MLSIKSNKLRNAHASPFFRHQYTAEHELNEHEFYERCGSDDEDAVDLQSRSQAGGDGISQVRKPLGAGEGLIEAFTVCMAPNSNDYRAGRPYKCNMDQDL